MKIDEVKEHVELYFREYLSQYTILENRKKSYHPEDDYLYMISAKKKDGTYAVWTNWNAITKSLNYGHYDLTSIEECEKIFEEFYYKG